MSPAPELEFVQLHPDDRLLGVFEGDRRFELRWEMLGWHPLDADHDEYFTIRAADHEVARLHLIRRLEFVKYWADVPDLGEDPLRIQMIEVAADARGRGIATAVVRHVQAQHPGSRLLALSHTAATGFWESLGWLRCDHATERRYQPLFVGPAPQPSPSGS